MQERLSTPDPGQPVAVDGLRMQASALCIARAFELWTHENDIRAALGHPASVPDASTLALMTQLAVRLLPGAVSPAVERQGDPRAATLRLVLTGPGGGTWHIPLGAPGQDAAGVGIVTDAVGFCRLVANRAAPHDLDTHVTGDAQLAAAVLRAATPLALD